MNPQWQEFLNTHGANMAGDRVMDFGDASAELQAASNSNSLADLSHLGLLQIAGADATTFLQGQVTNDVSQLNGSNSHYAGYCTAKGRLLALFLVFAHHDHLHLQLNGALMESVMKRLKMYVLRSKVSINDVSDSIIRLGLAGKHSTEALQQLFTSVPQQAHELISHENATLLRLPNTMANSTPRYEIFTTPEHAPAIWLQLKQGAVPAGAASWEWLEIQAGIPDIEPATQEAFVPQMVNLDALGGINFKKGCYTGQEIVARTHYLGKVKRRTQLAHIATSEAPKPGDDIFSADGNEPVGKLVRVAIAPQGGFDMLAEIRLESLAAGRVRWNNSELEISELPYSLTS